MALFRESLRSIGVPLKGSIRVPVKGSIRVPLKGSIRVPSGVQGVLEV